MSLIPIFTLDSNLNVGSNLKEDSKEQSMGVDVLPIIVTNEITVPPPDLIETKDISPILPTVPIAGNNFFDLVKIMFF